MNKLTSETSLRYKFILFAPLRPKLAADDNSGIVIGEASPQRLLERFPRLKSTLDTGIRSMLTVILESGGKTVAALVLASTCFSAYNHADLELVRGVGAAIVDCIEALREEI